jgi:hypothetical protein
MMISFIVIALALFAIGLFFIAARSRRRHMREGSMRPLDLQAFHCLIDREDERFLRESLSRAGFMRLKRQRISVTFKYVARISNNAAAVLQMAEAARQNSDMQVAEAATQVVDMATQIRMQCMIAQAKLAAEFMFPSLQLSPALLVPRYQALRETLSRLGSLQNAEPLATAI